MPLSNTKNTDDKLWEEPEGVDSTFSKGWGAYPLNTVFVRAEHRTVSEVMGRIDKGRYRLDPEFQREFVWPEEKQSRLIESCLMRIPLPVFYVAEDPDGKIVVVDGLQRLTTFHRFMNNEFALSGLSSQDSESKISGKKFNQLPTALKERIEDTQLTLYILDAKAPERARLDIFDRVNSGVPLTRQQMRNSLYSGQATQTLKTLATHPDFLKATGRSLNTKTMRDREVVNRFCSFYLLGYESYTADMEGFLAQSLIKMNKMPTDEIDQLTNTFLNSMRINRKIFREHSFRKSISGRKHASRTVLNVALFDVLSVLFANHADTVQQNSDEIYTAISNLLKSDTLFIDSISHSTNSVKHVNERFSKVLGVIKGDANA